MFFMVEYDLNRPENEGRSYISAPGMKAVQRETLNGRMALVTGDNVGLSCLELLWELCARQMTGLSWLV